MKYGILVMGKSTRESLTKRTNARQECRGLIALRERKSGLLEAIYAFLDDEVVVDRVWALKSGNLLPNQDLDAPISAQ